MRRSLRDRVLSRLIIDPSGCLLWTGFLIKGYGAVQDGGRPRYVHRLMYEWFVGPIPDGTEIDHLCRVKRCAAPSHLEAVTHHENLLRAGVGRYNAAKTHCPSGHPYDEANTYRSKGKRFCKQCTLDRKKAAA